MWASPVGQAATEGLLVDLACFGRPARLVWHKHRWECINDACEAGSWTGQAVNAGRKLERAPVENGSTWGS